MSPVHLEVGVSHPPNRDAEGVITLRASTPRGSIDNDL